MYILVNMNDNINVHVTVDCILACLYMLVNHFLKIFSDGLSLVIPDKITSSFPFNDYWAGNKKIVSLIAARLHLYCQMIRIVICRKTVPG